MKTAREVAIAASYKYLRLRINKSNSGNFYFLGFKYIEAVHEVQNAVYCLTGQELIYKG